MDDQTRDPDAPVTDDELPQPDQPAAAPPAGDAWAPPVQIPVSPEPETAAEPEGTAAPEESTLGIDSSEVAVSDSPEPSASPAEVAQPTTDNPIPELPADDTPAAPPAVPPVPSAPPVASYQSDQNQSAGSGGKRKLLVLLMGLLLLLALAGGGYALFTKVLGGGVKLESYENQKIGFTVQKPVGWAAAEDSSLFASQVRFEEPKDADKENSQYLASMTVTAPAEDSKQALDEKGFFEKVRTNLKDTLGKKEGREKDQYIEQTDEKELQVDGKPALKVSYDIKNFDFSEGQNGQGIAVFVFIDETHYLIVEMNAHESDQDFLDRADKIFGSIDLKA